MNTTSEAVKRCSADVARRQRGQVLCLVLALLLSPPVVLAQPPAATNAELPTMVLKVCAKLEDAKSQADLSFQFAKMQAPTTLEPRFLWQGCTPLPVIVRPRSAEPAIAPFETWAVTYDPSSSTTVEAKHAGTTYTVPYVLRKQRVRYFLADFMVPVDADDPRIGPEDRGKWLLAWVEIPDAPYLVKYLERRKP